jgi:hypothetical protein
MTLHSLHSGFAGDADGKRKKKSKKGVTPFRNCFQRQPLGIAFVTISY